MSFKRILVSLDFSDSANAALAVGCRLASALGAELHLAHVIRTPLALAVAGPVPSSLELQRALRKDGKAKLKQAAAWAQIEGVSATTHLLEGQVSQTVVQLAQDQECDLIVLGRRGLSRVAEVMLGSVADHTVRLAPCPVMIVRAEDQ